VILTRDAGAMLAAVYFEECKSLDGRLALAAAVCAPMLASSPRCWPFEEVNDVLVVAEEQCEC